MNHYIELSPDELALVLWVAHKRHTRATVNRYNATNYPNGTLDGSLEGNIRGAKCELGAARYLGVYWSGITSFTAHDLAPDIEVKSVRNQSHGVVVRTGQTGRIVSAYATTERHDPHVILRGWCHAADAWEHGEPAPWGDPNTRLLAPTYLNPIHTMATVGVTV